MSKKLDIKSSCLYIESVTRIADQGQDNRVRVFRRRAELTQADLAAAVDVSRQTVISIEAGDYSPSVHLALRLADVLGATVEALFGDEEE